jgi:predicted RNase H-like nuclease (RuvC/YqgF family)
MQRLLAGLLDWQISTDYAPRIWQARKQLRALDQALLESQQRARSLRQITEQSRARFAEFEHRIDGQDARIKALYERVGRLIAQQESRINQLAINAVEQQQQQITRLRLNARYSLARLYDSLVSD